MQAYVGVITLETSVKLRAIVTAEFAALVDAVNQYAAVI